VGVVVSSGGSVGDTVGLGVGVGEAEEVAVDVGDGVSLGVGSGDAVPDGELPALGGIPVPDGTSVRAVEERAKRSALVDAESPLGTRAGAGRDPTGGATSLGGPELASSASRVKAVVAGCSGTLSFEWMAIIATIATTAKEQPTTAISRTRSSSRPISPRCLSVCEDKQCWTVTRSVTISAIPFRSSDRALAVPRASLTSRSTNGPHPVAGRGRERLGVRGFGGCWTGSLRDAGRRATTARYPLRAAGDQPLGEGCCAPVQRPHQSGLAARRAGGRAVGWCREGQLPSSAMRPSYTPNLSRMRRARSASSSDRS
jgi:hypothetical protein